MLRIGCVFSPGDKKMDKIPKEFIPISILSELYERKRESLYFLATLDEKEEKTDRFIRINNEFYGHKNYKNLYTNDLTELKYQALELTGTLHRLANDLALMEMEQQHQQEQAENENIYINFVPSPFKPDSARLQKSTMRIYKYLYDERFVHRKRALEVKRLLEHFLHERSQEKSA